MSVAAVVVGEALPAITLPPLTLATLQAYADASGDHAEVHLNEENARSNGFPTAIAHGLLAMAWVGRVVTDRFVPEAVRHVSARFVAPVLVGETLTCSGVVEAIDDGVAEIALVMTAADGSVKIAGRARVAVGPAG